MGTKITGSTSVVGVIGNPVKHSLSPQMHNAAFQSMNIDWVYVPFITKAEELEKTLRGLAAAGVKGVNITIPFKEDSIRFLDEVTETALHIGSVNMIRFEPGKMYGDNSDWLGFSNSLGKELDGTGKTALIYGAGGSAKAAAYSLLCNKWKVKIYNRTVERANQLARQLNLEVKGQNLIEVLPDTPSLTEALFKISLLVNCTPIGMYPDDDKVPAIAIENMPHSSIIFDLIYRPLETRLMAAAAKLGIRTMNGVEMLIQQGALSIEYWTGLKPPLDVMRDVLTDTLH